MKKGISSPSLERKQARLAKWGGDKKESRDENLEMKPEIDTAINIPYCIVSVDFFIILIPPPAIFNRFIETFFLFLFFWFGFFPFCFRFRFALGGLVFWR